jgi:hypothetical protein
MRASALDTKPGTRRVLGMAPIDDYFVSDDIFPADLAIVFGMTTWRRPCARAVELYRDGMRGSFSSPAASIEPYRRSRPKKWREAPRRPEFPGRTSSSRRSILKRRA